MEKPKLTEKELSCLRLINSLIMILIKTVILYTGLHLLDINWTVQNALGLILLFEIGTFYIRGK